MARKVTNQLLEMLDEGLLDKDQVILACLKYMSEDDVADMAEANEFLPSDEDEDEDEDGPPADWDGTPSDSWLFRNPC